MSGTLAPTSFASPGANTLSVEVEHFAPPTYQPDSAETLSRTGTVNLVQLTNTSTVTPPSLNDVTHTTHNSVMTVNVPVGAPVKLRCAPNLDGPKGKYQWSGMPAGSEISTTAPSNVEITTTAPEGTVINSTNEAGATQSASACEFFSLVPGTYTVTCVYSWDEYKSGSWDWEGTIPYNKNADGTDRDVPRQSITVTYTVNVIKLHVVIDHVLGLNDPDTSENAPVVSGSFITSGDEGYVAFMGHVAETEWAAEYEPYIQWGYKTYSGMLGQNPANENPLVVNDWSNFELVECMPGANVMIPLGGFQEAPIGRTQPLSAKIKACIPLTGMVYVADLTEFVPITQDALDQERQSYLDIGGSNGGIPPSRSEWVTQEDYLNVHEELHGMCPDVVFCRGQVSNDCTAKDWHDTDADVQAAKKKKEDQKEVCRSISHHGVYAPVAINDTFLKYYNTQLEWKGMGGPYISVTCCYRCPIHNQHITTSSKGVDGPHPRAVAFDYGGGSSDIWDIAASSVVSVAQGGAGCQNTRIYYSGGPAAGLLFSSYVSNGGTKTGHTWTHGHVE